MRCVSLRALAAFMACSLVACGTSDSSANPLVVFAAASLRDVATDLGADFEAADKTEVVFNFAGSNTLAQQIKAAPKADIFLSADQEWVEFLDQNERTVDGSRRDFLGNRFVLIAHRDATFEIDSPLDLATARFRFLALADPVAVPAGRYARASLERLPWNDSNLWEVVSDRVAPARDVRAALALVETDPEILGIVYQTDTTTSDKIRVLVELPEVPTAPIVYCATQITDGRNPEAAHRFLNYLMSPSAGAIAEQHGFTVP